MTRQEVTYTYEYWDCACGHKAIRGDVITCPSCGHPRDEDIRFYRKDGPPEVIADAQQLARFQSGPDWVCAFCQELNPATNKECRGCGNLRSDDKNYFENVEAKKRLGQSPSALRATKHAHDATALLMLALACFGFIGGFGWWLTRSHLVDYQVSAVHWQCSIPLERYQWFQAEDWQSNVHGDGVVRLAQDRVIRSYDHRQIGTRQEDYEDSEQYQSGTRDETSSSYESLGNGAGRTITTHTTVPVYSTRIVTRTRTVPVYQDFPIYDTKVRYKAKEYRVLRTFVADGSDNHPRWPDVIRAVGLDGKPDREGARQESLLVTFSKCNAKDTGPPVYSINPSEPGLTQKYLLGKHIRFLVRNLGGMEEDLQP